MRDLKTFLELIRIPGVFTAHADILAGALIAGAGMKQIPDLVLLLIASSCFFSAGMALNDFFDRNIDQMERPTRPIPSGRISKEAALFLGMTMLTTGVIFAFLVNAVSFTIALLAASAILLYDGGLKKIRFLGPLNMGFCRYLNLLLGLSILPLSSETMLIPVLTWLYIFGITVLSSSEVSGHNPTTVIICLSCIMGVTALYWLFGALDLFHGNPGIYLCLGWMAAALFFSLRLFFKTAPSDYQQTIKWLLLLLVILDGTIVIGARSMVAGLLVFPLIFPGGYVAKRFYVT
jgi:hypothetical protein